MHVRALEVLEVGLAAIVDSRARLSHALTGRRFGRLDLRCFVEVLLWGDECDLVRSLVTRFWSAQAPGCFDACLLARARFQVVLGGLLALHGQVLVRALWTAHMRLSQVLATGRARPLLLFDIAFYEFTGLLLIFGCGVLLLFELCAACIHRRLFLAAAEVLLHVHGNSVAQRLYDGLRQVIVVAQLLRQLLWIRVLMCGYARKVTTAQVNSNYKRLRFTDRQVFEITVVDEEVGAILRHAFVNQGHFVSVRSILVLCVVLITVDKSV